MCRSESGRRCSSKSRDKPAICSPPSYTDTDSGESSHATTSDQAASQILPSRQKSTHKHGERWLAIDNLGLPRRDRLAVQTLGSQPLMVCATFRLAITAPAPTGLAGCQQKMSRPSGRYKTFSASMGAVRLKCVIRETTKLATGCSPG